MFVGVTWLFGGGLRVAGCGLKDGAFGAGHDFGDVGEGDVPEAGDLALETGHAVGGGAGQLGGGLDPDLAMHASGVHGQAGDFGHGLVLEGGRQVGVFEEAFHDWGIADGNCGLRIGGSRIGG